MGIFNILPQFWGNNQVTVLYEGSANGTLVLYIYLSNVGNFNNTYCTISPAGFLIIRRKSPIAALRASSFLRQVRNTFGMRNSWDSPTSI